MISKNQETVITGILEITDRHRMFTDAVEAREPEKMIVLFQQSQAMCTSLLADICDDPDLKLKLTEATLACKEQFMPFEHLLDGVR